MKAKPIAAAAIALLCAGLLWAQKAWEKKAYSEWTQREVKQVLQESPWARSALFQGYIMVDGPVAGPPRAIVRWESALTVRQALVRREALAGRSGGEAVAEYLAATPPNHVLVLFGAPLASRSFQNLTEEVVRDSSYLELAGSKQKVKPVAVRLHRQGVELASLEFHFPREMEGKPVLSPEQKKVGFYCGMGPAWFSTEFDLTKMVRDGKPDL